ncbi:urocortin [Paroedura picta]|uniref:urocortin n=1 Tax=Paroedura picta TaxID=143630 RepID=UPI0010147C98
MKRALSLPMLVAVLLLVWRAPLGAAGIPDFDGNGERGLSLRVRLLPWAEERSPRWPLAPPAVASEAGRDGAALAAPPLPRADPARELRRRLAELSQRLKRHEPPLSIDLTFHLLRHMLEISRAQSQQEQAQHNRLLFDALGK